MSLATVNPRRWSRAFVSALLLTSSTLTSALAAPLLNWDATNNYYIDGTASHLTWSFSEAANNVWISAYDASTPVTTTDTAKYSGLPLYGAGWMSSQNGTLQGFTVSRIRNDYKHPSYPTNHKNQLEVGINPGTNGPAVTGGALVFFKKEDFAGPLGGGPLGISETSSVSVTISRLNQTTLHFAILNDDKWYISKDTLTTTPADSPWTLAGDQLYSSLWAEWSPTGGIDGRLADTPGSEAFDVSASDFQNIQAIGLFSNYGNSTSNQYFYMSGFYADVAAIPEPGLAYLLLVGGPVYWFARRCKRKAQPAL